MNTVAKNKVAPKAFLSKESIYLVVIFSVCCAVVFTNTYFDYNHACSKDSIEYLKLAQNLLDGKGYHVPAYGETKNSKELFAIWPVGYSTLIYLVAKVTTLPVLWASKVVNLGIVAALMALFHKFFKKDGYLYSMLLLLYVPNVVFSTTLSEAPYILGLVLFTLSMWKLLDAKQDRLGVYLCIFAAFLIAFLSRYTGFVLCGLTGAFAGYFLFIKKQLKVALKLGIVACISAVCMGGYLFNNLQETGFVTGLERTFRSETLLELALMYTTVINMQICFFASNYPSIIYLPALLTQYLIFQHFFKTLLFDHWKSSAQLFNNNLFKISVVVAFTYYACVLGIRAVSSFHLYHPRLLYPGSLVLLIGIVYSLMRKDSVQMAKALKGFLSVLVILSVLTSTIIPSMICHFMSQETYKKDLAKWNALYEGIDEGSIVVFGLRQMNYRHLHVQIRQPREYPFYAERESWDDFMERVRTYNRSVYLLTPLQPLIYDMLHPTVAEVVQSFEPGTLVDLNDPEKMTVIPFDSLKGD